MIKINDEVCSDIADFFKIFGDAGRIKILCALVDNELCVNDIVKFRKDGKTVYYSLDDEHVSILLKKGIEHIKHKNGYEEE